MIYVRKANGSFQEFNKEKIIVTCLKLRAPLDVAKEIAEKIEKQAYNGITTDEILRRIYALLAEYNEVYSLLKDPRKAISEMKSSPDFEQLIKEILEKEGFSTRTNIIMEGKCTSHEIDVLAEKSDKSFVVEVKHHIDYHYYIGKAIPLQYWATVYDINEISSKKYGLMIFSNCKYSEHAIQFAECRKITLIGWKYPKNKGIETLIENYLLYPITLLRTIGKFEIEELSKFRIVTIHDLAIMDVSEISRSSLIKKERLEELKSLANKVLEFLKNTKSDISDLSEKSEI